MTETMQGFILLIFIMLLFGKISYVRSGVLGVVAGILSLTHPLWYFFCFDFTGVGFDLYKKYKKVFDSGFFCDIDDITMDDKELADMEKNYFRSSSFLFM
jgi:hypothetical protein